MSYDPKEILDALGVDIMDADFDRENAAGAEPVSWVDPLITASDALMTAAGAFHILAAASHSHLVSRIRGRLNDGIALSPTEPSAPAIEHSITKMEEALHFLLGSMKTGGENLFALEQEPETPGEVPRLTRVMAEALNALTGNAYNLVSLNRAGFFLAGLPVSVEDPPCEECEGLGVIRMPGRRPLYGGLHRLEAYCSDHAPEDWRQYQLVMD